ncbi:MAG: glutamate 5-kinase [Rhodospirillales bacterium]
MTAGTAGKDRLTGAARVVVKIGSALLVDQQSGDIRADWLATLAEDVMAMRAAGQDVLIVSSGAIAAGRRRLGFAPGQLRLEESQAAAACGMMRLAHAYEEALAAHGGTLAQVLLTLDDSEDRRRYINARNTLTTLLKAGAVPLINENDTVATDEIRFGDNDRLAARVAAMTGADALVLFSSVDGFYSADPSQGAAAEFIPEVREITPEIEAMAGPAGAPDGSGGMITKLAAAKIAVAAGCHMAVADGRGAHPVRRLCENGAGAGTWFIAQENPRTARKAWIAGSLKTQGALILDSGAVNALKAGKSLLPAGVTAVEGRFRRGDAVVVKDAEGRERARGLVAYNSEAAAAIMGRKTREIEGLLGYRGRDEMIHRDDLVLS